MKVTINTLREKKVKQEKVVACTAYSYPDALIANDAGIEWLLCGDSYSNNILGYKSTIGITLEEMLTMTRSVVRGNTNSYIVGDMSFGSYQNPTQAVANAFKYFECGIDCLKLEGHRPDVVKELTKNGLCSMIHLGYTPQRSSTLNKVVQGRTDEQVDKIIDSARELEDAGASFLLLEAMPAESAQKVKERLSIPTYGIGSGSYLDGQLLIISDILGMSTLKPKFVKQYINGKELFTNAIREYVKEVKEEVYPSKEHCY